MYQPIAPNFFPAPIFADEWHFGASPMQAKVLQENGDWRSLAVSFEKQRKKIETMSCVTYTTLNAIEILHRFHFKTIPDYSERFTSTLAGTSRQGNTYQKVLETVRKYGLIKERLLPFNNDINTWDAYFAPIPSKLKKEGERYLRKYELQHDWVFTPDTRKDERYERLKDALQFSPVPVTVNAWSSRNGIYYKNGRDNHACLCVGYDQQFWYILDTYPPYLKRLEIGFEFGYAKRLSLKKRSLLSLIF